MRAVQNSLINLRAARLSLFQIVAPLPPQGLWSRCSETSLLPLPWTLSPFSPFSLFLCPLSQTPPLSSPQLHCDYAEGSRSPWWSINPSRFSRLSPGPFFCSHTLSLAHRMASEDSFTSVSNLNFIQREKLFSPQPLGWKLEHCFSFLFLSHFWIVKITSGPPYWSKSVIESVQAPPLPAPRVIIKSSNLILIVSTISARAPTYMMWGWGESVQGTAWGVLNLSLLFSFLLPGISLPLSAQKLWRLPPPQLGFLWGREGEEVRGLASSHLTL